MKWITAFAMIAVVTAFDADRAAHDAVAVGRYIMHHEGDRGDGSIRHGASVEVGRQEDMRKEGHAMHRDECARSIGHGASVEVGRQEDMRKEGHVMPVGEGTDAGDGGERRLICSHGRSGRFVKWYCDERRLGRICSLRSGRFCKNQPKRVHRRRWTILPEFLSGLSL